jgi:hypothetical protein
MSPRHPQLAAVPGISKPVLAALAKSRVTLVQHLLAWPEAELARHSGLSQGVLRAACTAVHAAFAARCRTASDERALDGATGNVRYASAMLEARGPAALTGAREAELVELVGLPGSGKTQLCLTAAAAAASSGKGVVLFDTSAALSVDRIVDILAACDVSPRGINDALRRTLVIPVGTLAEAGQALSRLVDDVLTVRAAGRTAGRANGQASSDGQDANVSATAILRDVGLIVFDSPAALLAPVLGWRWPDGWTGYACSNEIATRLRALANLTRARVLTTNRQVRAEQEGDLRAALGRSWAHVCDVRLFLEEERAGADGDAEPGVLRIVQRRTSSRRGPVEPVTMQVTQAGVSVLT